MHYTVARNPKMNGVAERLNRTLVEKARSMLIAGEIDRRFWIETVNTVNYLKNRSPTAAYGKQFIAKHLQKFGLESTPKYRIYVFQSGYLEKMLQKFNMADCKGVHTSDCKGGKWHRFTKGKS